MKERTSVETRRVHTIELDREDLLPWLRRKYSLDKDAQVVIFFQVPGGADWSNQSIDVDADNPIHVRIETVEKEWVR